MPEIRLTPMQELFAKLGNVPADIQKEFIQKEKTVIVNSYHNGFLHTAQNCVHLRFEDYYDSFFDDTKQI